jgi:choloylglycine hydrolase
MGAVEQLTGNERTQYTSCIDTKTGTYYYTTYENSAITSVELNGCPQDGAELCTVPLRRSRTVFKSAQP